jgi:hypothetical protein
MYDKILSACIIHIIHSLLIQLHFAKLLTISRGFILLYTVFVVVSVLLCLMMYDLEKLLSSLLACYYCQVITQATNRAAASFAI